MPKREIKEVNLYSERRFLNRASAPTIINLGDRSCIAAYNRSTDLEMSPWLRWAIAKSKGDT